MCCQEGSEKNIRQMKQECVKRTEDGDSADELRSKTKNCTKFSKFSKDKVVCLLIVYTS